MGRRRIDIPMTPGQARRVLGVCVLVVIVGYLYTTWQYRKVKAEHDAEVATTCAEARAFREKMRRINADLEARPPKTPREVAMRLGSWQRCGAASYKAWNKYSRFSWDYAGPQKPWVTTGAVYVHVNQEPKSCDPDAPIVSWEVFGHDKTDDDTTRLYSCQ